MSPSCMAWSCLVDALHTPPMLLVIVTLKRHAACLQADLHSVPAYDAACSSGRYATLVCRSAASVCPHDSLHCTCTLFLPLLSMMLPTMLFPRPVPALTVPSTAHKSCYPRWIPSQACPLAHWGSLHLQCCA